MEYLRVKSWGEFQHYKDDRPLKWIKVYSSLLMDYKFEQITDAEFGQLVKIWLLASQLDNLIPNDPAWIQKKCGLSGKPNIDKYIQMDFLQVDGSVQDRTVPYENVPREEKSREEKHICAKRFEDFYQAYPKKKSRDKAEKAWLKIKPDEDLFSTIMQALEKAKASEDWKKSGGQYIPHPATWLNGKRWEDEIEVIADEPTHPAHVKLRGPHD